MKNPTPRRSFGSGPGVAALAAGLLTGLLVSCSSASESAESTPATSSAPALSVGTSDRSTTSVAVTVAPSAVTTAAPTTAAPTTTAATAAETTSPPTTTPPTEAPTTTIDPMQIARERFFVVITTANTAGADIASRHPLTAWGAYPAYCAEMAVVARSLADEVSATSWPAGAAAQATDLSAGHTYLATLYDQCAATDGSYEALVGIDASLREVHGYVSLANVEMRVAIGLPADR